MKFVWIRFRGNFYAFNTHCTTLKEWFESHPGYKRSDIAEWWKSGEGEGHLSPDWN